MGTIKIIVLTLIILILMTGCTAEHDCIPTNQVIINKDTWAAKSKGNIVIMYDLTVKCDGHWQSSCKIIGVTEKEFNMAFMGETIDQMNKRLQGEPNA